MSKKTVKVPSKDKRNILITSALPYCNSVPHLGNLIGSLLSADVYARYCRLKGYNALYICGTDQYGTASETKALEEGVTPRELCSKYHKLHCEIYDWFNIEFDHFGATSTESQTRIAQDIFKRIHERGYTLERTVEQLYCGKCERFLSDRYVEGTCPKCNYKDARGDQCDQCTALLTPTELVEPRCKVCSSKPSLRDSEHIYIDLPKLEPKLREFLEAAEREHEWTPNCVAVTNSWLKSGLQARAITRDLKWGTPVPLEKYKDKVFYVWFDAPIGYISITAEYAPDDWQKWWKAGTANPHGKEAPSGAVELVQFMGKDNVPFHSIIFPSTLLGADDNYTLAHHISTTDYLQYEDLKFSKSRGTGVFGDQAKETGIPAFAFRYYLLSQRPETGDSVFTWQDFMLRNNTELLANIGNFCNRALKFCASHFDSAVPRGVGSREQLSAADREFVDTVNKLLAEYTTAFEAVKLRDALRIALQVGKAGNQLLQANKPWELVKGDADSKKRCGVVISLALNLVDLIASLLWPFTPSLSEAIAAQLGRDGKRVAKLPDEYSVTTPSIAEGHRLGDEIVPLVQKISAETADELRRRFAGKVKEAQPFQVDLRVGKVLEVAEHPDESATHLYVLKIACGDKEPRQIVSGLRAHYAKEELVDRHVVVIANLKASKFKGVKSEGMVLCGDDGDGTIGLLGLPSTLDAAEVPPLGTNVLPTGYALDTNAPKNFNVKKQWAALKLHVGADSQAFYGGGSLSGETFGLFAANAVDGNDPVKIVVDKVKENSIIR